MVLSTSDAGVQPCDDPDVTSRSSANPLTNMLCLQYSLSSVFGGGSVTTASVNVKYALAPPFPPIDVSVAAGDGHLKVYWAKGDDAEIIVQYDVHVEPETGGTDGGIAAIVTSTYADVSTTDDGQPLQNDAGYFITIVQSPAGAAWGR